MRFYENSILFLLEIYVTSVDLDIIASQALVSRFPKK